MNTLFTYFKGTIKELIALSMTTAKGLIKKDFCEVNETLVTDLAAYGVVITTQYKHVMDNNAIRHVCNQHASENEILRGQIAITEKDIENIPEIVLHYDQLFTHKNRRGQDVIVYSKENADGMITYVEEIRVGRKELAMDTIYKRKNGKLTDANSKTTQISDLSTI